MVESRGAYLRLTTLTSLAISVLVPLMLLLLGSSKVMVAISYSLLTYNETLQGPMAGKI